LHREWDSANAVEAKLPPYLRKMGNLLRDHIKKMKDAGVTSANPRSKEVQRKFSTKVIHVDSLARIKMELYFRNLDLTTIGNLQKWGVKFNGYGYEKGAEKSAVVNYFKQHDIPVLPNYTTGPAVLDCNVPFDTVEGVAKLPSLVRLNAIFYRELNQ
jgi:hypothetical protein